MLSSVLRSERAIQMNIVIMRAFVRLRELVAAHKVPISIPGHERHQMIEQRKVQQHE